MPGWHLMIDVKDHLAQTRQSKQPLSVWLTNHPAKNQQIFEIDLKWRLTKICREKEIPSGEAEEKQKQGEYFQRTVNCCWLRDKGFLKTLQEWNMLQNEEEQHATRDGLWKLKIWHIKIRCGREDESWISHPVSKGASRATAHLPPPQLFPVCPTLAWSSDSLHQFCTS